MLPVCRVIFITDIHVWCVPKITWFDEDNIAGIVVLLSKRDTYASYHFIEYYKIMHKILYNLKKSWFVVKILDVLKFSFNMYLI